MAMKMDRRAFLKTSAAVAVAASMTGLLGGCSDSNTLAPNEVRVGQYRVSIHDLDIGYDGSELEGLKKTLKAKVTLKFEGGPNDFQATGYAGMFTASLDGEALETVAPVSGMLIASNFMWGTLFGKTTVDLEMRFNTDEALAAYKSGTPAELTIKIFGNTATMYLVKQNGKYVALRELI